MLKSVAGLEEKRGRDSLLRQLQKLATPETLLEYMKYEPHEPGDILLLTGVGKIYPFAASTARTLKSRSSNASSTVRARPTLSARRSAR